MEILKTGTRNVPPKILIYGPEGCGKSTFGAQAPNPLFIQTEDGLNYIRANSLPLVDSWETFKAQLEWCKSDEAKEYQTIVLDSVDWLERLIHDDVAKKAGKKSIEEIGYGKGFLTAGEMLQDALLEFSSLQKMGKIIILIAHAKIEKFADPQGEGYDRYSPSLGKKTSSVCREWADDVIFMNFRIYRKAIEGEGMNKGGRQIAAKAERVMFTSDKPSFQAKTRSGLPEEIEVGDNAWIAYAQARKAARVARMAAIDAKNNSVQQ